MSQENISVVFTGAGGLANHGTLVYTNAAGEKFYSAGTFANYPTMSVSQKLNPLTTIQAETSTVSPFGKLITVSGAVGDQNFQVYGSQWLTNTTGTAVLKTGSDLSSQWAVITNAMAQVNSLGVQYHPLDQNSNSAWCTAAMAAGLPVPNTSAGLSLGENFVPGCPNILPTTYTPASTIQNQEPDLFLLTQGNDGNGNKSVTYADKTKSGTVLDTDALAVSTNGAVEYEKSSVGAITTIAGTGSSSAYASGTTITLLDNSSADVTGSGLTLNMGKGVTLNDVSGANTTINMDGGSDTAVVNGSGLKINGNTAGDLTNLGSNTTAAINGSGGNVGIVGTGDSLTTSNQSIAFSAGGYTTTIAGVGDTIHDVSNGATGIILSGTNQTVLGDSGNDLVNLIGTGSTATISGTGGTVGICASGQAVNATGETFNFASTGYTTYIGGSGDTVHDWATNGGTISLAGTNQTLTGDSGTDLVNLAGSGASATISGSGGTVGICATNQTLNASGETVNFSSPGFGTTIAGANDYINDVANGSTSIALTGTNQTLVGDSGNDLVNLYGTGASAVISGSAGTVGVCGTNEFLNATGETVNFSSGGFATTISGANDRINDVSNGNTSIALTGTNQIVAGDSGNDLVNLYGNGASAVISGSNGTVGICGTNEALNATGETVNFSAGGFSTTIAGVGDHINDVGNSSAYIAVTGQNQIIAGDTGNDVVNVYGGGSSATFTSAGGTVGIISSGETITATDDHFNFSVANETVTIHGDGDTFGGTSGDRVVEDLSSGGSVVDTWSGGAEQSTDYTGADGTGSVDGSNPDPGGDGGGDTGGGDTGGGDPGGGDPGGGDPGGGDPGGGDPEPGSDDATTQRRSSSVPSASDASRPRAEVEAVANTSQAHLTAAKTVASVATPEALSRLASPSPSELARAHASYNQLISAMASFAPSAGITGPTSGYESSYQAPLLVLPH